MTPLFIEPVIGFEILHVLVRILDAVHRVCEAQELQSETGSVFGSECPDDILSVRVQTILVIDEIDDATVGLPTVAASAPSASERDSEVAEDVFAYVP